MNRKQERTLLKRMGTKKHYRETMQKRRCHSFLNQKLGTVTHKTGKDYDRQKKKISLKKELQDM